MKAYSPFLIILLIVQLMLAACSNHDPEPLPEPEPVPTPTPTPDPAPEPAPEPDPDPIIKPYQYHVARLTVDTGGEAIKSKENYIDCTVKLESDTAEWCYEGSGGIRGRGNSSWLWYDKKPYRIKLKKKASLMGMGEGKSWVLLANYRDPADLMNTFVFELGNLAGLKYTNHTRYVELTLNGEYVGLYQLTEQVQQGKGRVNIDEDGGYLISLDRDDGPELAPRESDNFWSGIYGMPVCVKNPDNVTMDQKMKIRGDLKDLEEVIKKKDYDRVKEMLDVQSMIDYLIIQEFVYNVELDAPRSMFMYRDIDGDVWHMGPLWDFDAGYDFDWSNMTKGHNYFASSRELVMGTKPYYHTGTIYDVPRFFTDLFGVKDFVNDYKARWTVIKDMVPQAWELSVMYVDDEAWRREQERWPVGKDYLNEISRMHNWLVDRLNYMDTVIANY